MKNIQILDKSFKLYLPHEDIQMAIDNVAQRVNSDLKNCDTPVFLCVLTGAFMFLSDLMKRINVLSDIAFIRVASYEGTQSTGEVKEIMGLTTDLKDKTVIIVEDIVDTGTTIAELHKIVSEAGAKEIKVCTLLLKPNAYKGNIKIDYAAIEIPNDFIVGYGLDYNQLGRHYKDIYVINEDKNL